MQATPATWQLLLQARWQGNPRLKILCGGEAMTPRLAQELLACGGELWNMYGPTETTIWSSALRIESSIAPILIGPPIANTQFYVVDPHQQLVPMGVPGELWIGGRGVALGYRNLPETTAERFVADRFRGTASARLYRTGDIVRRRGNGCLEYIGRTDSQVKLRGYRIELGEIESALLLHSDVTEAAAIMAPEPAGDAAIRAYVNIGRGGATAAPAALRDTLLAHLRNILPSYMLPASIAFLERLPRTPNGKVDRSALPVVSAEPSAAPGARTAESLNEVEARLAEIFKGVLGITHVDRTTHFFEAGGHSLLAARLLTAIESQFHVRVALQTLFRSPTIEALASLLVRHDLPQHDFRKLVRLQSNGSQPTLFAIHNTGVYYQLSKFLGSDQPFTCLQLFDPSLPRQAMPQTFGEVAAEYAQLVRQLQPSGPYSLVGWCLGGALAFEVARNLAKSGEDVAFLAIIDAWAPGYLKRLPRLRSVLADRSFRLQLIAADVGRLLSRKQSLGHFLRSRTVVKKLLGLDDTAATIENPALATHGADMRPEDYDNWLFEYIRGLAADYTPSTYAGRVTLFRSSREPSGLFLNRHLGWGDFARGGIDVVTIRGDHFSIFQQPGVTQMAERLSVRLKSRMPEP
jgi:thioesterase domain-containing protein/acyl carrier protein